MIHPMSKSTPIHHTEHSGFHECTRICGTKETDTHGYSDIGLLTLLFIKILVQNILPNLLIESLKTI
jgi:hypothetical protein